MSSGAVVGTWRAAAPETAWLSFAENGTVVGSDGCNPVNGTYTLDGADISFALGLTTLRACPGVTISFVRLRLATLHGDVLHTATRDGSPLADLRRS